MNELILIEESRRNAVMKEKQEMGKVIPFPGLAERYADKGMEALINKQFKDAAAFFEEAIALNEELYNAQFGLVVVFVELGKYEEAKLRCQSILQKGLGDYFKTMEMYLMILLQLNEYEEMEATISALSKEGYIPFDKEEHFNNMLSFSRRMSEERKTAFEEEEEGFISEFEGELDLFSKSDQEQLILVSKLKNENIRKYIDEIKDYLQSPEGHPFVKTTLLLLLKEQELQDECDVEKFLKHVTVVPAQLEDLHTSDFFRKTVLLLEEQIAHENPSLWDLARQLAERHHFLMYPFEPKESAECWAAAHQMLAEQYQGEGNNEERIARQYGIDYEQIIKVMEYLQRIEDISSI